MEEEGLLLSLQPPIFQKSLIPFRSQDLMLGLLTALVCLAAKPSQQTVLDLCL